MIHFVDALARVPAWVRGALVDVGLAVPSCKANRARSVWVVKLSYNFRKVLHCQSLTGKAQSTSTVVIVNQVDACGSVLALTSAVVEIFSAGSATPALEACALKAARFVPTGH